MFHKARIAQLEGELNAANGNVNALTQEKATLEGRIQELETAQAGMVAKADHETALQLKDGEIETLKGKVETAEKSVDKKVVEKIADAGVPAAVRDPAAVDNPAKPNAGDGPSPRARLASLTKIAGGNK